MATKKIRKQKKEQHMLHREWQKIKKRYPFLTPRFNEYWARTTKKEQKELCPDLLYDIPSGWVGRFGYELCEELRSDFVRHGCLTTVYIGQAKEKYGELCIYFEGLPPESQAEAIVQKYAAISSTVCSICGKLDSPCTTAGWVLPVCEPCAKKHGWHVEQKKIQTPESYTYRAWNGVTWEEHRVSFPGTVLRLRKKSNRCIRRSTRGFLLPKGGYPL